ncbi:unnamed protein product [Parnassius mnemosyne]|uniref:Uncharacterized protein n=1 Tax=Parnassius mnemosyne TaxID=213953 RepID=A0AAV1KAI8_9NEOP
MSSSRPSTGKSSIGFTGVLVLLLVVCLIECATEQRINNRGSKASSLIEKVNGWRSQRGGSCLSYGHSCWGAHGKRSDKSPSSAPDWYLTKILRHMTVNSDLNRARHELAKSDDANDIFRMDVANDVSSVNNLMYDNEEPPVGLRSRNLEAKPMLDDNVLTNMRIWQLMRQASEEN